MIQKNNKKPNRYDFAKATWGEKLLAWSKQDGIGQAMGNDVDSVFASVAEYDFTKDSKKSYQYLFWLCKLIIKSDIKPEDVYKVKEDIEIFLRVQNQLPRDKRDISRIKSADELSMLVDSYRDVEVKSLGQLAREEREAILNETLTLYEGEHGRIIIPITKRSAIFWGQGTRWCFAATKTRNHFNNYHNRPGPLIVYLTNEVGYRTVIKNKKKEQVPYQIKFAGHKISVLRNIHDFKVDAIPDYLKTLVLHSEQFDFLIDYGSIKPNIFPHGFFKEERLIDLLDQKKIKISDIHEEERTENMYLISVKQDGRKLQIIPKDKHTDAIRLAAVTQNGLALQYVSENKRTDTICLAAVTQNSLSLADVPVDKRNETLCLMAITQNLLALKYVPPYKRTEKIKRVSFEMIMKDDTITDKKKYISDYSLQSIMTEEEKANILNKDSSPVEAIKFMLPLGKPCTRHAPVPLLLTP